MEAYSLQRHKERAPPPRLAWLGPDQHLNSHRGSKWSIPRRSGGGVGGQLCACVCVCVEKLNVHALFEATEREEKLNHACANVNWLCTVQWCGTERQGEEKRKEYERWGGDRCWELSCVHVWPRWTSWIQSAALDLLGREEAKWKAGKKNNTGRKSRS